MNTISLPHNHSKDKSISRIHLKLNHEFSTSAELFRILGDTTRIRLFWILCHGEECVTNLAYLTGVSSPAVSHHIRFLKKAGLVESRRDGKEVYYKSADNKVCRYLHLMTEEIMNITCPETKDKDGLSSRQIIRKIHDYLLENLSERITIEEISKKFHINPTTLKKTFKDEYQMSVAAHIKQHRLEKAANLLITTDDSIFKIAKSVGYESQSKFTQAFKEVYGVLPTSYRNLE